MIKNLLQRMNRSAYVGRLAKTFPIFAFILILQLFLSVHLLGEGSVMRMGTRAFLQIWRCPPSARSFGLLWLGRWSLGHERKAGEDLFREAS